MAKEVIVEFLSQATIARSSDLEKFAKGSLDTKRITNMLREAQAVVSIEACELDQHPDKLVFLNGTVDLKTGKLGPHCREDLITKIVNHAYVPDSTCPLFRATLFRLMGGVPNDSETDLQRANKLVDTLQLVLGYALTGRTSEKVVFILYGDGNNGKTTILSLFVQLLGPYAALLQIETLMVRSENSNSQADLADLCGARFVMTSETEEGQRLAEGKLKRITQGMGKVKAVRKYENPFTFPETHKLFVDANHKPIIRGTDSAIWNRVFPIPFTVTIPKDEIDRDLPAKLLAEAEGILAWAVAGAARWYREGLIRPEEVDCAVNQYRDEMDQIGRFIRERCASEKRMFVSAGSLYEAYRRWAAEAGECLISSNLFGRRMSAREGLGKKTTSKGPLYLGIGLRERDSEESE